MIQSKMVTNINFVLCFSILDEQDIEDVDPGLVDHRVYSSTSLHSMDDDLHPNPVADHSKKHTGWTVNDVDFLRMLPWQLFRRAPEWMAFLRLLPQQRKIT